MSDSRSRPGGETRLQRCQYKGWQAWSITRGPLELVLAPHVGGRIMGLRWHGQELLFTQPEREGAVLPPELLTGDVQEAKRTLGFPLWGGDKTWLAPQSSWPQGMPYLDLDSGPYELEVLRDQPDGIGVSMTSRVCRETGVRLTRTVTVSSEDPTWTVQHRIQNGGTEPITTGLWDVCMVLRPARVILPRSGHSSYPDGLKIYAEEGESASARPKVVRFASESIEIDCTDQTEFKYGVDGDQGWIKAVVSHNTLGLISYTKQVPVSTNQPYAHGCVAEVYNSAAYPYFEMELHGPLVTLQPGESYELEERQWIEGEGENVTEE